MVKGLIARIGGKTLIAKTITSYFPDHQTYVEPFIGGGSILYNKPPSPIEIINDLDKDIYDIYNDLCQVSNEDILKYDFISNRETFNNLLNSTSFSSIKDRLYRNLYLSNLSFGGGRERWVGDKRANIQREAGKYFKSHLDQYKDRLKDVKIYNVDFRELITKYDNESTFFYLDPPYSHCKKNWGYKNLLTTNDIYEAIKNIKGKFILSYDDSPEIRNIFKDFYIKEIKTKYSLSATINNRTVIELLISNFNLDDAL